MLTMGEPAADKKLARQLRRLGVALQTIREFGGDSDELLLDYGQMSPREIERAAELIARATELMGVSPKAARRDRMVPRSRRAF